MIANSYLLKRFGCSEPYKISIELKPIIFRIRRNLLLKNSAEEEKDERDEENKKEEEEEVDDFNWSNKIGFLSAIETMAWR